MLGLQDEMRKFFAKIIHGIAYIFYIVLFFLLFPISNLFLGRKKIWIINERGYDARDNGYHFFKYVTEKHPEIRCYYAIHKKSSDYINVKDFKNVIEQGSLKHIFLFSCARAKISSQVNGFAPNKYYAMYMQKHHLQGKNIGLKHGIFKNIHKNYFKENSHLDLIIAGAKPEYDFIKENFHFDDGEVAYCGLARFDNLHGQTAKNQILVMPTFRIPLANVSNEEFTQSEYYQKWLSILKKLDQDDSSASIVFYIHAMFQKFVPLFEGKLKKVLVAKFADYDIQTLLKESALLVTDYSSVYFDFAYMKKPVVFYQFDEEYFNKYHYEKGYFDYRRDGFGKVCIEEKECLEEINRLIDNKFNLDEKYQDRLNDFFQLNDDKNCERIFNEIVKIV